MSLIHAALEKLEMEKEGVETPVERKEMFLKIENINLEKKVTVPAVASSKLVYGIGGALILFFALGVGYLFFVAETEKGTGPAVSSVYKGREIPGPVSSSPVPDGQFSLTGTSRVGADWLAIVNNQLVRVGEWVSGAEVKSIQDRKVTLDFRGQTVTLHLY